MMSLCTRTLRAMLCALLLGLSICYVHELAAQTAAQCTWALLLYEKRVDLSAPLGQRIRVTPLVYYEVEDERRLGEARQQLREAGRMWFELRECTGEVATPAPKRYAAQ